MGVNIHLLETNGKDTHNSKELEFDSFKYSGDREYGASQLEWVYLSCPNPYCCDYLYKRPKNIEEHKDWIKKNIVKANQKRLLEALDRMANNDLIYFNFSY